LHLLGQPDAFRAGGATAAGGVLAWCGEHGGTLGIKAVRGHATAVSLFVPTAKSQRFTRCLSTPSLILLPEWPIDR
jgi:hypothetical protein